MMMRLYVLVVAVMFAVQANAQLVINEVSQGASGNQEYVELIVTGTPTCGNSTVDLRGWIIDDNNGWHETGSGAGIAAGHVRFANIPQWAAVKIGAMIVIYNDADEGTAIAALSPDVNDANADCRYIVPVSSNVLEKNTTQPSSSQSSYTAGSPTYTTVGTWTILGMANGGDAFHTVSPANYAAPYHAIGWGGNSNQVNVYFANAQGGRTIYMANIIDDNPFNQANYVNGNSPADETPGLPNNIANAQWILSLNNNCQPVATSNVLDTVAVPLCQGDTVNINNTVISTAGSYRDTIPTTGVGCDTIRTYNVTLSPYNTSTVTRTLCQGQSTVINGQTITTNGTYLDTVASTNSCDTILTYNVTFNPLNTRTEAVTLCPGQSVVINGATVTTAGTYTETRPSTTGGCDTTVTYNVTTGSTIPVAVSSNLCPGESVLINGQQVTTAGTYTETRPATGGGCDTTVTYTVTSSGYIQPAAIAVNRCQGQSVTIGGTIYTTAGTVRDTISSATTCDTIYTYNLTFNPVYNPQVPVSICQGDSYFAGGAQQTTAGTYTDNFTTVNGCDSIVTTILTIVQPSTETITADVCVGDSYEGTVINNDTTYTVVYTNQTGCDSTVTYNLTAVAKPVVTLSDDVTIDEGESVTLTATGGGNYLWSSGQNTAAITETPVVTTTYYVTVSNTGGCSVVDSAIVTVIPAPEIDVKIPTAFSPNNDGRNDLFDVLNRFQVKVDDFRIYNRWGELVYNNPDGKWDGKFRNVEQPVGVYVYYLKVTYIKSGKQDALSGNVTLLR